MEQSDLKAKLEEAKTNWNDSEKLLIDMKEAHKLAIQNQKKLITAAKSIVKAYEKALGK